MPGHGLGAGWSPRASLQAPTAPFTRIWIPGLECRVISPVMSQPLRGDDSEKVVSLGRAVSATVKLCALMFVDLPPILQGLEQGHKKTASPPNELLVHNIYYCGGQNKSAFIGYLLSKVKALGNYIWVNFSVTL